MNLQIFTVYDKKACAYMQPIFMRSEAEAVRALTSTANDQATQFFKTPGDFHLVHIGEFDDLTGVVSSGSMRIVVEVSSLVQKKEIA